MIGREEWIRIGKNILETAVIGAYETPPQIRRTEFQVSYPRVPAAEDRSAKAAARRGAKTIIKKLRRAANGIARTGSAREKGARETEPFEEKSARAEALARSFLLASFLIREDPAWSVGGFRVADYYREHILRACTAGHAEYLGSYPYLAKQYRSGNMQALFQHTIEAGLLSAGLLICRGEVWDLYSQAEKDTVAAWIRSFAEGATVPQNWQLMNMLALAFLHRAGYPVDPQRMSDLAEAVLQDYAGDGWYRDGHSFDYYSLWGYQFAAPLWCVWYGYEHLPAAARRFERYSNDLVRTGGALFGENGRMIMWGRSIAYRNAVTAAWPANLLLRDPAADPAAARKLCSQCLLQFYGERNILKDGVLPLGFYGTFPPAVQPYSCSASPLWCAEAFACLLLPPDHPFWSENEGCGEDPIRSRSGRRGETPPGAAADTVLEAPGLCLTRFPYSGSALLRSGKVLKERSDRNGKLCYAKLCYSSDYLWEAADHAQQYAITDGTGNILETPNVLFWAGYRGGVLYRRAVFDLVPEKEMHWHNCADLADIAMPLGLLRADRVTFCTELRPLKLGSFGFPCGDPHVGTAEKGAARAMILSAVDPAGRPRQMAMTVFDGWDALDAEYLEGTNPESRKSVLLTARFRPDGPCTARRRFFLSQVISKDSEEPFTEDELFPVRDIRYDPDGSGCTLLLADGRQIPVSFEGINGRLSL